MKFIFHAFILEDYHLVYAMRILGSRLMMLRLFEGEEMFTEEYAAACDSCTNLEVLFVTLLRVDVTRAIIATPKDNLKVLRIYYTVNEQAGVSSMETIMDLIAEGTRNVQILDVKELKTSLGAFDNFIGNNKSSLRSFSVINTVDDFIT